MMDDDKKPIPYLKEGRIYSEIYNPYKRVYGDLLVRFNSDGSVTTMFLDFPELLDNWEQGVMIDERCWATRLDIAIFDLMDEQEGDAVGG